MKYYRYNPLRQANGGTQTLLLAHAIVGRRCQTPLLTHGSVDASSLAIYNGGKNWQYRQVSAVVGDYTWLFVLNLFGYGYPPITVYKINFKNILPTLQPGTYMPRLRNRGWGFVLLRSYIQLRRVVLISEQAELQDSTIVRLPPSHWFRAHS